MKNKRKKKLLAGLLVCLCLLTSLQAMPEKTYAADSYSNAKLFFESTGLTNNGKHIECHNGMVYFATKAKAATSSTALKYTSIGFDVTLTGADHTLTFAVKRGGSLAEIKQPADLDDTYNYRLYCITTENLHALAKAVNPTAADAIFSSDRFEVRMDAIMTTKQNGVDHGAIKENGDGTITVVRTPVYHLNKISDLNALKSKFNNEFESFRNISAPLTNITTNVYYSVDQSMITNGNYSSQTGTIINTSVPNLLHENGVLVHKEYKALQRFTLLDASGTGPKIKKTGYHLGDGMGGAVWKKGDETFSITRTYGPKDLNQQAGTKSTYIILSPNWQPNNYTIHYDPNGGTGVVNDTAMVYDTAGCLKENTFKKEGYYIEKSKAWIDANGKTYANGQAVINLTTIHNDTVTLKANWQPIVAQITLDKQGGSGGTDAYFQKYATGFYTTNACTTLLNMVSKPNRTGYDFTGYYTSFNGMGSQVISNAGAYLQPNTYFKGNATIYANWKAKTFPVTFDKQGGRYGSDSVIATYGQLYPVADAPERPGFRFMGYYTGTNGTGTQIYNEFMSSTEKYELTTGTTLYAYWVDDILPVVNLTVSNNKWTNRQVTLTAEASDFGSGLDSVHIYRVGGDGTLTPVASATNLNDATTKELAFTNTTEGIVRYKAVATDKSGNTAESYNVVYYDTKAPTGTIIDKLVEDNRFYFDIDITDINTGN